MRHIVQGTEPLVLRKWKKDNAKTPQNLTYRAFPEKDKVKEALLKEQGYLCAYTLRRLSSVEDCHIEHIQPQNVVPGLDLDYANMAACFPKDGGDTSYGYGAPVKGGQPVDLGDNFISPHQSGCEQRFSYAATGEITSVNNDPAVSSTISILKLDHPELAELRRAAMEAHGLSLRRGTSRRTSKPKSAAEARRFAQEVILPDGKGRLEPFCIALAQVALVYAEREEKRAQRMCSTR